MTFPADLAQTPRPELPGLGTPWGTPVTIDYHEGAEIGYRWFAQRGETPLYPFGHGLSYTTFEYTDVEIRDGSATLTVTNTGDRDGTDVPQLYLDEPRRLLAFERVELAAGESRRVTLTVEPRLLTPGERRLAVAASAGAGTARRSGRGVGRGR
jgi:beta-glucosidase